ncbi:MAG: response regulator transcription factor [Saccharofermentanales bacterium]
MFNVLIVDDEPSVLNSLRRIILGDKRFHVIGEAYSARQAKAAIEEQMPDIMFTDIRMPGESGIELLKYIVDSQLNILTVVLSGFDNFDYVHDAFIYGAEEYLLKPIEPSKVLLLLDKIALKLTRRNMVLSNDSPVAGNGVSGLFKSNADKLVDDLDLYLEKNLEEDNSMVVICKKFVVSQPYLSKIIKKAKNCTYNEYLISLKINAAKQLLKQRPDLLIADVSEETGFSDQFYFSRVFKNVTRMTPTEYRNSQNV